MQVRRNIDAVVMQIRREIAEHCIKIADERREPPLDQQEGGKEAQHGMKK